MEERFKKEPACTARRVDHQIVEVKLEELDACLDHRLRGEVLSLALAEGRRSQHLECESDRRHPDVDQAIGRERLDAVIDRLIGKPEFLVLPR